MSRNPVALAVPDDLVTTSTRPVRTVLALVGISLGVTAVGSLLVALVAPQSDQLLRRLPVVLVLLVMSLVAARRIGWAAVAAGNPTTWRQVGWLAAPLLLALVPLAWGWSPDPTTLVALAVGYAATGVYEELWFRGVALRAALPLGPGRAAALTAVVFGVSHLANALFGQNVAVTAAQAFGAAAFGFGYAVLRLPDERAVGPRRRRTPDPTCSCTRPACTAARCGPSWSARTWCCSSSAWSPCAACVAPRDPLPPTPRSPDVCQHVHRRPADRPVVGSRRARRIVEPVVAAHLAGDHPPRARPPGRHALGHPRRRPRRRLDRAPTDGPHRRRSPDRDARRIAAGGPRRASPRPPPPRRGVTGDEAVPAHVDRMAPPARRRPRLARLPLRRRAPPAGDPQRHRRRHRLVARARRPDLTGLGVAAADPHRHDRLLGRRRASPS